MIVEYIRYRLSGDGADLERAYQQAAVELGASPNCLGWELSRCDEDAQCYVLRIEWDSVAGHLEGFRKSPSFQSFLGKIRPFIDQIEEMRHYTPTDATSRTICDALGGPAALFSVAKAMHTQMRSDALLGPRFAEVAPTHVPHLGMWLTEVFGGPKLYSAVFDDIAPMLQRHRGGDFTEEERVRFVELARAALESVATEGSERAVAAAVRYFEWGSTVAVENSRPEHRPDPGAGVPVWSWES